MGRRAKQKRHKRKKGSSSSSGVEEDNPTRKIFKAGSPSEDIDNSKGLGNSTDLSDLDVSEILQKANSVLFCECEVFQELNDSDNSDNSENDDTSFTRHTTYPLDSQTVSTPVSYLPENSSLNYSDSFHMGKDIKMQPKERPRELLSKDGERVSNSKEKVADSSGESQAVKLMPSDTTSNSDIMKFLVQFQSQVNRKLSEVDSKLKILDQLERKSRVS